MTLAEKLLDTISFDNTLLLLGIRVLDTIFSPYFASGAKMNNLMSINITDYDYVVTVLAEFLKKRYIHTKTLPFPVIVLLVPRRKVRKPAYVERTLEADTLASLTKLNWNIGKKSIGMRVHFKHAEIDSTTSNDNHIITLNP